MPLSMSDPRARYQGNRILMGEEPQQVVLIPAGVESFGFDADRDAGVPAQQMERQPPEHGETPGE
jgi:hypothetical protein